PRRSHPARGARARGRARPAACDRPRPRARRAGRPRHRRRQGPRDRADHRRAQSALRRPLGAHGGAPGAARKRIVIQLLIAAGVATLVTLGFTRYLIGWLTAHRIGQPIHDDVPEGHTTKAGTPTMGGLAIVAGLLSGYMVTNLYRGVYTRTGLIVVLTITAAAGVGLMDDWIKVSRERNLGLSKRAKMAGLLLVSGGFI